jgi:hypothetical protein
MLNRLRKKLWAEFISVRAITSVSSFHKIDKMYSQLDFCISVKFLSGLMD